MATIPSEMPEPTIPGQPIAPSPEVGVPGEDIDMPSPMPGNDPGEMPAPGQPIG